MTEGQLQDAIRLEIGSDPRCVLWRNNVGMAWMRDGKPIRFGVGGPGAADLIGMCAGRFVAIEIKTPTGRLSVEQKRFAALVERHGGTFMVLRSVEDARAWLRSLP